MPVAEIEEFPHLLLSIAASRVTGHILWGIQLRINLALKPPGLILSQMPMESVDLIERKDLYLALDLLQAYVRASRVVHKATDSERGPVYDLAARDFDTTFRVLRQLPQRLDCPIDSHFRDCLDDDLFWRDRQIIRFFLIDNGLFNTLNQLDIHFSGGRIRAFDPGSVKPLPHDSHNGRVSRQTYFGFLEITF